MTNLTIQVNVTEKEKEIVNLLADGATVPEISKTTGMNKRTLEAKIAFIKLKYHAQTAAHLAAIFLRNKLID